MYSISVLPEKPTPDKNEIYKTNLNLMQISCLPSFNITKEQLQYRDPIWGTPYVGKQSTPTIT
jgi:hypothetical protein